MAISAYTKTVWANGTTPAISATTLGQIETQLKDITDAALTVTAWTPTVIGSSTAGTQTYGSQVGIYIKIGKLVFVQAYVNITAKDAGIAGTVRMGGLPVAANSTSSAYGSVSIAQYYGITLASGLTQLGFRVNPGTSYFDVVQSGSATASALLPVANLAAASGFYIGGVYLADS